MTVSPFDSTIFGGLFSDPEIAPLFSDEAVIRSLIEVEVALAKVQGNLRIIPAEAAARIANSAKTFVPDVAEISTSTATSGVPTIALVRQFRAAVDDGEGDAGAYLHWGATSQDIIDTGLVLRLQKALKIIERRIDAVAEALANLAHSHRQTVMVGRTRSQAALPTTFGLKAAGWLDALLDGQRGLSDLIPRLLRIQFGGAVGALAALGGKGIAVGDALASELGLQPATAPWHSNRASIVELAGQLTVITGGLGKIGQDIVLLAQTEVGEVRQAGSGGGSSAMPQKSNPITAETLISLARMNAGLLGAIAQAQIQEHERGGPGWQLEWLTLPQMVLASGAALRHAQDLLAGLIIDEQRMGRNIDATKGLVLAEAISFALSEHMDRSQAHALLEDAIAEMRSTSQDLISLVKSKSDAPIEWDSLADPANYLGVSDALITRILNRRR